MLCLYRRRTLKSTLHPAIFWEMVKFVDLGVLYFSLVLPWQPTWVAGGPEWTLRALGGMNITRGVPATAVSTSPFTCVTSPFKRVIAQTRGRLAVAIHLLEIGNAAAGLQGCRGFGY